MTSRLANSECRNWVEVGQALLFLSETVQSHASNGMKAFYDLLTVTVGSETKCRCTYAPGVGNKHTCKWAQAVVSYHREPAKIAWWASNSSKWDDAQSGPSEIASLYTGKQSADGLKYLQFLRSCSYFNISEKVLSEAIDVWERLWGTAPHQKLGHEEKFRALEAITKVLHESLFKNDPNTKKTLKDIQSIEFWDLSRLRESEIKVARKYREMLENKRLQLTKDIMDLDTNLDNVESFLAQTQDPCQQASVPLQDSFFWLFNFLAVNLTFLTKSRKSKETLLAFFRFLSLCFHYTFAIVVLVVIMVVVGSVTMVLSMVASKFVAKHVL